MAKKKASQKRINRAKENIKKENIKETDDLKTFLKVVAIIALSMGLLYGLTYLLQKKGFFQEGYTKPQLAETVISYDTAIVGTIFNRPVSEYYVILDDFTENVNQYINGIIYRYEVLDDVLPIYKVDMSLANNNNYVSKDGKSNSSVQTSTDLSINGPTLIKIKNGKNVLYIEGELNIENELLK